MGLAPAGPTQALFKNAPGVFVGAARSQARGLSNWRCQLSNPGRGFSSPPVENIKEKSPYLRTGSHLEYGGEGGIDSLRSPLRGSPLAGSRSVQLALPVVEPRSGVLIPPSGEYMAVRGGLTRFARPCGAARSQARGLSNWRCQLSNPGRGFSSPPAGATCEKKARTCVRALLKIWR